MRISDNVFRVVDWTSCYSGAVENMTTLKFGSPLSPLVDCGSDDVVKMNTPSLYARRGEDLLTILDDQ